MKCLILLSLFFIASSYAETFNIRDRINYQELYLKVYRSALSQHTITNTNMFKREVINIEDSDKRKLLLKHYKKLSPFFPPIILRSILYYRYIQLDKEVVSQILHYAFLNKIMAIRDQIDTTDNDHDKIKLLNLIKEITEHNDFNYKKIYRDFNTIFKEKADAIASMKDADNFITALLETKIVNRIIKDKQHKFYQLTNLGIIPGNKVQWFNQNNHSLKRMQWYNEHLIFKGGVLDFDLPFMKMPQASSPSGHPAFKHDPIFIKIKEMILQAKESIFIDIFLMGGTLGGTLAEFLLDQTKEKLATTPSFKVVLLHDYSTHYGMKAEMLPIFKYMNNRINKDQELSKSVYLLQANIQRHPPGIPFGLSNFIPKTEENFAEFQKRSSYYESKVDHSKVLVIDGNTNRPAAYFGSKNWTDHKGGYDYDDALYVEGPMAALIQHSYYRDIEAALTINPEEEKFFYYQKQGLDNRKYRKRREQILQSFRITKEEIPYRGRVRVRLAEADVDGSIKNARNLIIDLISNSKKKIYMEQRFLYDKYVVDALIKKKIENEKIDIRIILDSNQNLKLGGFPNAIFIKEMKRYGIQIRIRKTLNSITTFPDGSQQVYNQENHRNVISSDSKHIIFSSSNITPASLQGSFRELGAEVFSSKLARNYEVKFQEIWSDPNKTLQMDIENFQFGNDHYKYSKSFSALIDDIAAFLIRSKVILDN